MNMRRDRIHVEEVPNLLRRLVVAGQVIAVFRLGIPLAFDRFFPLWGVQVVNLGVGSFLG